MFGQRGIDAGVNIWRAVDQGAVQIEDNRTGAKQTFMCFSI